MHAHHIASNGAGRGDSQVKVVDCRPKGVLARTITGSAWFIYHGSTIGKERSVR